LWNRIGFLFGGVIVSFSRAKTLSYLRLIVLCTIVVFYWPEINKRFDYFNNFILPSAKNGFLFASPQAMTGECYISDFTLLYAGGLLNKERLENNLRCDVYDPILTTETIAQVISPLQVIGTYCLQYPPTLFCLLTPLAYFNLYTAWCIWFMASALFMLITYICISWDALKSQPIFISGLFFWLISFPVSENFFLGQTSALAAMLIALSFRFLITKNYLRAGLVSALALVKLQFAPIILLPGICLGKIRFVYGLMLMIVFQVLISLYAVGYHNVLHFIRNNYLCEILRIYGDMNESWFYHNFLGLCSSLSTNISQCSKVSSLMYLLACLFTLALWIKVYPALGKVSDHALELIASVSVPLFIVFNLHSYWYDYLFLIFPSLWLYIWGSSNKVEYPFKQSVARLIISCMAFAVPFSFWTINNICRAEITITNYHLGICALGIILSITALVAVFLEFNKTSKTLMS
jgi:hypothetical protein